MKKTCVLFLLALLPLTVCAVDAVEIDGVWYSLDAEQGCATVASSPARPGYVGDVVIPESVSYDGETYDVTAIAEKAFYYSTLSSVSIGDGVTSIGDFAFYSCPNLVDVAIGNGVTSIGTSAFHWCNALRCGLPTPIRMINPCFLSQGDKMSNAHTLGRAFDIFLHIKTDFFRPWLLLNT